MLKFKSSLKTLGAAALIGISSFAIAAPADAQTSLKQVLDAVRRDSSQMSSEDQQRLKDFQSDRAAQSAKMTEARGALGAAEGRANALSAQFDANEATLGELEAQVSEQAGDFQELLGQFRTAAGETMPEIRTSLANFDYAGRVDGIAEIAEARTLPDRSQLERLPKAMLQEMIAQSEVKTFTSSVNGIGPDGSNAEAELMRVGVFTAATVDGAKFVQVIDIDGESALATYKAQPRGAFKSQMQSLINAGADDVVRAPVDPSKGALFEIQGELPTLGDRIGQGGPVGMVILGLLAIGLLLGVYKLFTLMGMGGAMRKSAKTKQAGTGNPLARVFETYETHKNADIETLELKLDEQILRESPKIERFNDIVKVLAAVAPLLGLLGTVVGMIITFTAITIYGAGDPKLMAGGISTALMTTVLGLVAAIPLLLVHAIIASMARGNQQILDEQAAGLVADKAETSRGAVA
jgi:biopolymer transport protein ExbB